MKVVNKVKGLSSPPDNLPPPFVIRLIIKRVMTFLSGVFLQYFVTFWITGSMYAIGSGWFAFLAFLLLAMSETLSNKQENKFVGLLRTSLPTQIISGLAILTTLLALVISFVQPPLNGEDSTFKPIAIGVTFLILIAYVVVSYKKDKKVAHYALKDEDDENDNEYDIPSCRDCFGCGIKCCSMCLMVLIILASLFTVLQSTRLLTLENDEELIFVNSNPANPDQKLAFRCSGSGEPLVLFFHGYSGQGLDFSHVSNEMNSTTICLIDRQGYGSSHSFGVDPRVSEVFAKEVNVALENLQHHLPDISTTSNLVIAAHSMGGFNSLAFDKCFGGVVGLLLIDPVTPQFTNDCFTGGQNTNNFIYEIGYRIIETGILLIAEVFNVASFTPIGTLPEEYQSSYIKNILRTGFFKTVAEEGIHWGETCEFVDGYGPVDYPVTVVIPTNGIYSRNLEEAKDIQLISSNGRTVYVDEASHTSVIFEKTFALQVKTELENLLKSLST